MPDLNLDLSDAIELAEPLTFLADWISSSQHQTLTDSLTAFVGHHGYHVDELAANLHASSSCSASATANNSSENPHHDQ